MLPLSVALFATVALLVFMGFFALGSLPLLILKHDTALDSRFIRGLFNTYYVAVMPTAAAGALSYAFAGQPAFSFGMGCLAAFAFAGRRWMICRMDLVRSTMDGGAAAIRQFRRLHIGGMLANVVQLGTLVWGMPKLTL